MKPTLVARRGAHLAIRAYQLTLSGVVGRQCRYLPTCSDYADEAIARHGFWAGSWMGLSRVCRCHPWGGSGYDPVPTELAGTPAWPWGPGRRPDASRVRTGPEVSPTTRRS